MLDPRPLPQIMVLLGALLTSPAAAQLVKLTPTDPEDYKWFGGSLSLDGGFLLVGAENESDQVYASGSAYLFRVPLDGGPAGPELAKFMPAVGHRKGKFGESVSLQDGIALMGAPGMNVGGTEAGVAYLFDADPSSPTFGDKLIRLEPATGANERRFGSSVSLDGGLALIGAPGDDGLGNEAGAAYLFDADPTSPTFGAQLKKLKSLDASADDLLGSDVSLHGGLALVGADGADGAMASSGAAYLFDADPTSPTFGSQLAKLQAIGGEPFDRFGRGVSMQDGRAVIGAPYHDRPAFPLTLQEGAAYLFDVDPGSPTFGSQLVELLPPIAAPHHRRLGFRVALDGPVAAVSSYWQHSEKGRRSGAVYLFDVNPLSPQYGVCQERLIPPTFEIGPCLGRGLALRNGVLAAGAPYDNEGPDYDAGSVYTTGILFSR